jgi:hypothetical protein
VVVQSPGLIFGVMHISLTVTSRNIRLAFMKT